MAGTRGIEAVLFDFDGTLYDLVVNLEPFKLRWAEAGETVTQILGRLKGEALMEALGQLEAEELAGVKRGAPLPGAVEALKTVRANHRVAVVSRNAVTAVEAGLAAMGITGVEVVGRESVGRQKPAADGIELALERLGARRGVMVGDSLHDVEAAAKAGMTSVVVVNSKLKFRPDGADYYVESLHTVPALIEDMV